jgi:hypothetical protein
MRENAVCAGLFGVRERDSWRDRPGQSDTGSPLRLVRGAADLGASSIWFAEPSFVMDNVRLLKPNGVSSKDTCIPARTKGFMKNL